MGNDTLQTRNLVRRFILDKFIFDERGEERLRDDTLLIDESIIDSFGIHEIILFLEETFGVTIEDEEVVPDNLGSVNTIVAFVGSKQAEKDRVL